MRTKFWRTCTSPVIFGPSRDTKGLFHLDGTWGCYECPLTVFGGLYSLSATTPIKQEIPNSGGRTDLKSLFGTITKIFQHTMYPGGPTKVFLQCEWYDTVGRCPVAGTQVVRKNPQNDWNLRSPFVPLDTCYQIPVAFWPYDPFDKLAANDPMNFKDCFDVIDRNQDQDV